MERRAVKHAFVGSFQNLLCVELILPTGVDGHGHRIHHHLALELNLRTLDEQSVVQVSLAIVDDIHVGIGIIEFAAIREVELVQVTGCEILGRVEVHIQILADFFHALSPRCHQLECLGLVEVVESVVSWLNGESAPGDLFIIQGEFGSTFTLVDFALKNGLVPLYATTRRVAKESRSGETVRREYVFEHVCFKKYQYFE